MKNNKKAPDVPPAKYLVAASFTMLEIVPISSKTMCKLQLLQEVEIVKLLLVILIYHPKCSYWVQWRR